MYCMCTYKLYARLLNAGEMYLMFLSCHTATGLLVNSCEWDCYWLENGALVLNLATELCMFIDLCEICVYT